MANQEHLDILKKGVEEWNAWRIANPDISPNLSGADLTNTKLHNIDLSNADLFRTDFYGAELLKANFRNAKLTRADLSLTALGKADLSNAIFNMAKLSGAQLGSAQLPGAQLYKANLRNAYLSSANLKGANLNDADLSKANLNGTDLSGAYLRNADLSSTRLYKVNLHKVKLSSSMLSNIDLTEIKDMTSLKTIVHDGPSSISTDTFIKSKGLIPEEFLKGVGLSDWEIEMVKLYREGLSPEKRLNILYKIDELMNSSPILLYPVFLSHSWADKDFTRKLQTTLDQKGVRCWLDEKQTKPGDKIIRVIDQAIKHYDKLVLICSKDSLNSWWVERELERVLEKERELNRGKKEAEKIDLLIPITIDNYLFDSWDSSWKTEVSRYIVGDFKDWKDE